VPEDHTDDPVAALWGEYKQHHTSDARERLILHYSPLVKFVAGRVASGLPQSVEQADLVSYGIFGLIDAIEKFDPSRGFKFETYAIARVKGAIIDELRSFDWVPRSVRAKARAIERAYSKLENELRRTPDDNELADELGMSDRELTNALSQISSSASSPSTRSWPPGESGRARRWPAIPPPIACTTRSRRSRSTR